MKKSHTFIVLIGLSVVAALWESWTILNSENGDTFSATLAQLGRDQPFIPFMFGLLSRHLWANDKRSMNGFLLGFGAGTYWPLVDGTDTSQITEAVHED